VSDTSQGPGWWLASGGRWYAPDDRPGYVLAPPDPAYAYPQYSGYYQYPAPRPTNGLAIASLILSILWLIGLGSVLAVIFASVALSKIKASHGQQEGRGLALAGLIIGIVGLIGTVGFFLIVTTSASGINQATKEIPASKPPSVAPPRATKENTVNQLGVTVNVREPSATGFTKVLVQDVAYPVPEGVGTVAIASVRVCAGTGGSQSAASSQAIVMRFSGGHVPHSGPDAIPSLGSSACTDAELYFELPPGSRPTYVAYRQYRWMVPAH
jgi:hypothetical protein